MMDPSKYHTGYFPVGQQYRKWVEKDHIEKAPVWCSVDMRDGNQSLEIPMSLEEKLEYYRVLLDLGFKESEVGFPAASRTEYDFLRMLIDKHMIPEDVTIQVLTQCREHIIRKTFDACKGAPCAIIHFYNSVSVAQREQADGSNTYMVGNILMDTLRFNHQRFTPPEGFDLQPKGYLVFTLNRKALLADADKLRQLLTAMVEAADSTPIVAPLRGEARKVVEALQLPSSVFRLHAPLSYLEFGWLTANALGIVTDSGNVAEEATFNGVPCITLNSYTEHQETVSVGSNVLVGEDADCLSAEVRRMVGGEWKRCALPDRWDGRTAERIVQILVGQ
jgi:hypothetical protein